MARVTTTRFPASGDLTASATLAAHFLENILRAGVDQQTSHLFTERARLIGRARGGMLYVLFAVHQANAGIAEQFIALEAGPRAHRDLAAALQQREQGALGDDGVARLQVIEFIENFGGLVVAGAAFDGDGALANRGHADFRRENFTDTMRGAEAVEAGFGEDHGIVFATFHFAKARIHVSAQIANVEIGSQMKKLSLAAQAAGTDARALAKMGESGAISGD